MTEKENWTLPAMFGVAVAILVVIILMANTANALSISITPTFNTLDTNMTIPFANTTMGLIAGSSTGYYLSVNGTSFNEQGNNVTFYKPGNYTIYESVTNGGNYSLSANSLVIVAQPLTVSIYPSHPQAVIGYQQPLQANVSGGTGPYTYQWYNSTGSALNATGQQYTTNALNQTTTYSVTVNDIYNRQAKANVTIQVSQYLYTPQGEVISVANHTAIMAPMIESDANLSSVVAWNVTPYSLFNISIAQCGTVSVYETGQTPSYANVSIDNETYNLTISQIKSYKSGCNVQLINVSWTPMIQTTTLGFFYQTPITTTTSSTSTTVNTTTSTSLLSTSSLTTIGPVGSTTTIAQTISPKKGGGWLWIVIVILIIVAIAAIWAYEHYILCNW